MSACFAFVWWNACEHRLDLGLYSHPKELWANGVRTHVHSTGKNPLYWKNSPQRSTKRTTLHQAGQRILPTTNDLFWPPDLYKPKQTTARMTNRSYLDKAVLVVTLSICIQWANYSVTLYNHPCHTLPHRQLDRLSLILNLKPFWKRKNKPQQ